MHVTTLDEALMRVIGLDEDVCTHPLSELQASVASFVRQVTETSRLVLPGGAPHEPAFAGV